MVGRQGTCSFRAPAGRRMADSADHVPLLSSNVKGMWRGKLAPKRGRSYGTAHGLENSPENHDRHLSVVARVTSPSKLRARSAITRVIYQSGLVGNAVPSFFSRNPGILWVSPWENRPCGSSATTGIPGVASKKKDTVPQGVVPDVGAPWVPLATTHMLERHCWKTLICKLGHI